MGEMTEYWSRLASIGLAGAMMAAMTVPTTAQDLPGRREALQLVYDADAPIETVVFPHPSLSEGQVTLLSSAMSQGLMPEMRFYGALAIAPDRGLADPQTTSAVGSFHSEDGAVTAALTSCDGARDEDEAACVVVMIVRPQGWQPGAALQLSGAAAEALRTEFRRAARPRVFAISEVTGQYGIGATATEANVVCGAEDCRAVVADD